MTEYRFKKSFWSKASVLFFAFALLFSAADLSAQTRSKKKDSDKPTFKDHLWYGGGFNLNFTGYNGDNVFQFGLSPMVGYKVYGPFSVGPRLGLNYTLWRVNTGSEFQNLNLFDVEPGLFARAKIFRGIFAHAESGFSKFQTPYDANGIASFDANGKIKKYWYSENTTYLGLGLNQGGGALGYDIYLLYDFQAAKDNQSGRLPIEYRFGLTYKF